MKVLTIANRKGGAGKTTFSQHLSVLAEAGGARVILVDCDPQSSLAFWWRLRKSGTPQLIQCKPSELARIMARARLDRVGLCIIDTPPHSEPSILDAMSVADLVLVPTRPLPYDLAAVSATLDLARTAGKDGKRLLAVINHAPPSAGWGTSTLIAEAREVLRRMGARTAETVIIQRIALSHAVTSGQTVGEYEPGGKAAKEISALWRELQPSLGA